MGPPDGGRRTVAKRRRRISVRLGAPGNTVRADDCPKPRWRAAHRRGEFRRRASGISARATRPGRSEGRRAAPVRRTTAGGPKRRRGARPAPHGRDNL